MCFVFAEAKGFGRIGIEKFSIPGGFASRIHTGEGLIGLIKCVGL
jgi:hypothetical protein